MQTVLMPEAVDQAAPPPPPATLEEAGLARDHVEQLLIKTLYGSELAGSVLAERVRLPYGVLEPLIERQRAERLIEVRGAAGTGSAGYRYALTDLGRERAGQYLSVNAYVGPAPVPLAAYVAYMRTVGAARGYIDRARLRQGFAHLVVSERVLEQLGPAVNANKALFLYGPPGNGKTVIGEGMGRTIGGDMSIPYALDVDGAIVTMYDPAGHQTLEADGDQVSIIAPAPVDRRWIRIRRPVVVAGGELTLDMLDLSFNPITRFHEAPLQLKANGGVFLVDDFGRQRIRPHELLNRWIVPLESRVDYLTLHTGRKFQIPFETFVVFATNLNPADLADEAFLRRIPYKIRIDDPTVEEFTRIFEMNCQRRRLPFHQVMVAYLQRRHYGPAGRPFRACHPRDLLDQISALCRYRGIEPAITRELLDAACRAYFVRGGAAGAPVPGVA
ncbi:MAG: hypothetical protein A3H29_09795 [Acidobacteria bacterium RIFCSPLOWO2_02_FULL_67_21]|nr:MAG: hypothetical protein A3H29_09795 [Acidobacteria bacterium RIFCSPLOWO2_02_FULL_67_21]